MKTTSQKINEILKENGLKDWTVKQSEGGAGLCLPNSKEILLSKKHFTLPFFLHEMTHALGYEGHDAIWADKFTQLLEKYVN